ncbi:MAG: class I SAM-dependent methyltransferase [bacterium]
MAHVRCDLCGNDMPIPLAQGSRFGIPVTVSICGRCGLVYQNPRMADDALSAFYQHDYRAIYSGNPAEPPPNFIEEQMAQGQRVLGLCRPHLRHGGSVLDVGCGPGGTLLPFREAGFQVQGIEPGAYGAWGAAHFGLDIAIGTLEAFPAEDRYDLVVLSFVLEHVHAPQTVLRQARRALAPQGLVYVEVPNLMRPVRPLTDYFHVAHLTYFTTQTLGAMLQRAAFEVLVLDGAGRYSIRVIGRRSLPHRAAGEEVLPGAEHVKAVRSLVRRQVILTRIELWLWAGARPLLRAGFALLSGVLGSAVAERVRAVTRGLYHRVRYQR